MYCAVDSAVFFIFCSWLKSFVFNMHWHCTLFNGMTLIYLNATSIELGFE